MVAASALLDRYGDVSRIIEADGFAIAARVFIVLEGETPTAMAKSTGLGLLELATVFDNLKPDIVVTVADRYETLATAVAAAYMNIPVAHVQGGEVTGSIDEKVRHAVTKLADLHLVSTQTRGRTGDPHGRRAQVGPHDRLSVDRSRARDAAQPRRSISIRSSATAASARRSICRTATSSSCSIPVTTEYEVARQQVTETLHAVHEQGMPTLWFWPNVDAGIGRHVPRDSRLPRTGASRQHSLLQEHVADRLSEGALQRHCLIGNSSVGIREWSFLGVPVVNIGTRQMGRDRGRNVIDVDYCRDQIGCAITRQLARGKRYPSDTLYGTGEAGLRIAECLVSSPLTSSKRLTY